MKKIWALFGLLFLITLLGIGKIDNDIYFLLNTGRYLVENGFTSFEPFTIHSGLVYQIQQWFSCIIFWKTYSLGGYTALLVLVGVVSIINIFVVYRLCLLVTNDNATLSFVCSLLFLLVYFSYKVTRPMIFTSLLMGLLLLLLETYIKSNKWYYLIPLPILSILQVNLHSAMWPMLVILMLPYLLDSLFGHMMPRIQAESYTKTGLWIATGSIIISGFLNPYGWRGMLYTFFSYSPSLHVINEMTHPDINNFTGKCIYLSIFVVVFALIIYRQGSMHLRNVFLILGTCYLTLTAIRSWLMFILAACVLLSDWLKDAPQFQDEKKEDFNFWKKMFMDAIAVILVMSVIILNGTKDSFGLAQIEEPLLEVCAWLDENCDKSQTSLYNDFENGGYLEFRGYRTYIDPRAEIFIKRLNEKKDIHSEYLDLTAGSLHYKEVFDKYGFTHLLIYKGLGAVDVYVQHDKDWLGVYEDDIYLIYQKVVDKSILAEE